MVRSPAAEQRESGIQPLHSFLLRQRRAVYIAILGVAIAAIFLAVTFASGAVDVAGPRWPWIIDLAVLFAFWGDHMRVAVRRGTAPTGAVLGAAVLIAGAVVALILSLCWW
ncbi:MAG TPA: hypothetical protein VK988_05720 [Acidimicrobiales bacterium]|nr:hypothetical protein [Acidimicrobiales bacterium]